MPNQFPNQISEELLNEEVTPDEMREILQRLGQREFGGSPNSTIRDIAEGTSADPILIGRLLAEIRNEELQSRLGIKVEEHEQRIEHIEHVQAEVQRDSRTYDPLAGLDSEQVEELRTIADARMRSREITPFLVAILIASFCIAMTILAAATGSQGASSNYKPKATYSTTVNGVEISGSPGGPITAKDHGKIRPATAEEEMEILPFMATSEANKSKGK